MKAKNGSAMVIFIYHPICKQLQSRAQHDGADQATVVDHREDEMNWGQKVRKLSMLK